MIVLVIWLVISEFIIDIFGCLFGQFLNLMIEFGQVWGVFGFNGVGKIILLYMLVGLCQF